MLAGELHSIDDVVTCRGRGDRKRNSEEIAKGRQHLTLVLAKNCVVVWQMLLSDILRLAGCQTVEIRELLARGVFARKFAGKPVDGRQKLSLVLAKARVFGRSTAPATRDSYEDTVEIPQLLKSPGMIWCMEGGSLRCGSLS